MSEVIVISLIFALILGVSLLQIRLIRRQKSKVDAQSLIALQTTAILGSCLGILVEHSVVASGHGIGVTMSVVVLLTLVFGYCLIGLAAEPGSTFLSSIAKRCVKQRTEQRYLRDDD